MYNSSEEGADLEQIEAAIAVVHKHDQVVEVRVPGKYGATSGYFDDHRKLAQAIRRLSDEGGHDGVYYTLNPCHPALLARRAKNKLHWDVKDTTSDQEIVRRRWLLFDFDPKRPKGVSATKEELLQAKDVMLAARLWLHGRGWPQPVVMMSGNGHHLLYRADLPNDKATAELFRDCLAALSDKFSTDRVEIDKAVFNAARITKAYGSLAAKGENTPDRPHRFSRLLHVPKPVKVVGRPQLEALARPLTDAKKKAKSDKTGAAITAEKVDEFLRWAEIEVKSTVQTQDGGMKWILAVCPFNGEHTNAPAVFLRPDGALGFNCFHVSCGEKNWRQLREAAEAKMGEPFHFAEGKPPYDATRAGLFWRKATTDGERTVQLTNFNARIVADIVEDDGVDPKNVLEIEAQCHGRKWKFRVPASGFTSMNWAIEKLGGEAIIWPGVGLRDHARAAIQHLSTDITRRRVFLHTGWRKIGGEWYYLHAGGAIGAEGLYDSIRVKLPPNLDRFRLPEPSTGERLKAAVRASLRLLDVAPLSLTVPIHAAVWRSVLAASDLSQHLAGPTNTFKSSLAALAMNHFGAHWDYRHLPGSWQSTANTNAALQFVMKDALLVIDDFVPKGSHADIERMHRDADRIFRGQGNNAGRGRMARDASLRDPQPPRGLTLSTGEDVPKGESLRTRVWVHDFSPGDVDKQKLTACQRDARAGLYAEVMSAFLQWLAPRYADVKERLPQRIEDYRDAIVRSGQHARTPEITANLMIGMRYFLLFAEKVRALSRDESKKIRAQAQRALDEAAAVQTREQAAEEPARRFLDLIAAAITRGDAHLGDPLTGRGARNEGGRLIGWTADEGLLLLEPDSAYATAHRLAQEQGEALPVGKNTMWKRLREQGFLARQEKGRNMVPWFIGGVRRRVLCLTSSALPITDPRAEE